ncbi:MAG: RNA polymerase factor sigma-54 [bacterium]
MDIRQDVRQQQRMETKIVMTPKLQQAIRLLQVPALELQQILKHELLTNPMLEEQEELEETPVEQIEEPTAEDAGEFKASENEIDWDRYLKDGFEMGSASLEEKDETEDRLEPVPVAKPSIEEYLMSQLRMAVSCEEDLKIGEFIIGSLDSNGYLTVGANEIAEYLGVDEKDVDRVLSIIRKFDPPGIGARDLRECLMIQLEQAGKENSLAYRLVSDHLDDLLKKKYAEISKKLKVSVEELNAAAEVVGKLDPRPGTRYSHEDAGYIVPDLIVEKIGDDYVIQTNDRGVPHLRVNRTYREILAKAKERSREEHDYVVDKLNSAKWLINTIEQRRQTMLKVMKAILEAQRDFFDKGEGYLKPLTLQEIAEVVGLHESTVSRVTSNKYVQTPRGVYNLKFFFSSGLKTDEGDLASSRIIKTKIAEMIKNEDRRNPLSDQEIAQRLRNEGFILARRTVAKYRDQLGILPARMRKEY